MMKSVVTKAEKQDPKGPFHKYKKFDSYLSLSDNGKKCFYDPKIPDFKAVSDFLESNLDVMREELSKITEVWFSQVYAIRLISLLGQKQFAKLAGLSLVSLDLVGN